MPLSQPTPREEVELGDEDILFVEDVADDEAIVVDPEADDVELSALEDEGYVRARAVLPAVTPPPPKPSLRPLVARHSRVDRLEDEVADECLASIAAVASRTRLADRFPPALVPPAPRLPTFDAADVDDAAQTTRRAALSSADVMTILPASVPGVALSSLPPPAFVRTSSASVPGLPPSSITPVAFGTGPGATVMRAHRPARTGWVVAAAVVGAACAFAVMGPVTGASAPAASPPVAAAAEPPPPAVMPPAAPEASAAEADPVVVRFGEDQGVAIRVDAPSPPSPPAPSAAPPPAKPTKPVVKSAPLGPRLPDGTVGLGGRVDPPAAAPASPSPALPAAAPSPKKKLTPQQQLAEAQLKASMK